MTFVCGCACARWWISVQSVPSLVSQVPLDSLLASCDPGHPGWRVNPSQGTSTHTLWKRLSSDSYTFLNCDGNLSSLRKSAKPKEKGWTLRTLTRYEVYPLTLEVWGDNVNWWARKIVECWMYIINLIYWSKLWFNFIYIFVGQESRWMP